VNGEVTDPELPETEKGVDEMPAGSANRLPILTKVVTPCKQAHCGLWSVVHKIKLLTKDMNRIGNFCSLSSWSLRPEVA
jgi:hypothetical protein